MALSDEIVKLLEEFGEILVADLQQSLRDKGVEFGGGDSKLSDTIRFEFDNRPGTVVFKLKMAEYGEVVETGRRPDLKPPPIKPIEDWIRRKGISPKIRSINLRKIKSQRIKKAARQRNEEDRSRAVRGMAIAISKNIGKNGTIKRFGYKGSKFYSEVIEDGRLEVLKTKLSEVLKESVQIEIINLAKI